MNPLFKDTDFRKTSGSGTGDCVEVAITEHTTDVDGLRDSKNPRSTVLLIAPGEWLALTGGAL